MDAVRGQNGEVSGDDKELMHRSLLAFLSKYIELTEDEKDAIMSLNAFRTVKKGTVLLKEGQRARESYFVLQGCLRVFYVVDGEEKTTAFYTEMESLTPKGVASQDLSEYFISCVEDSVIAISTPEMETEMFRKFHRFETLCRVLSEDLLARSQQSLDEFKTSSPEQRYVNLREKRPDLIQRVPQYQLASYLGITPQSLSRLRARLKEKERTFSYRK